MEHKCSKPETHTQSSHWPMTRIY